VSDRDDPQRLADIWFLNVGQGDCTVAIDRRTGHALVIDCPASKVNMLIDLLLREGARLHTVVVTHWDVDHYGGIGRAAAALGPVRVLYNHDTLFAEGEGSRSRIRSTLKQFLNLHHDGAALSAYRDGASVSVGVIRLDFLAPTQAEVTAAYVASSSGKRNIASAVACIRVGSLCVLIGGDAVAATWRRLLSSKRSLKAALLRWPHHGAMLHGDTHGTVRDDLLAAVSPDRLIVSTGSHNVYGHPAKGVIRSGTRAGALVMCTEVTPQCHTLHNGAVASGLAAAPRPRGAECAGDMKVTVSSEDYSVSPTAKAHANRVVGWSAPMCRNNLGSDVGVV
jgi:competence protein ComEC